MSNQIVITSGAKVRNLAGVLTGTSGVVSSVPLGAANGVATLDSGGKVPVSQLPSSVVTYLGTWNAATNTPTLTNGVGDAGDMYICNVAGTVNFGAGPVSFAVGDWVLYGSGQWQKSSGQNGTVTSVGLSTNAGAITIGNSPISTSGVISANFNGTNLQYVNGAGNLTTFPTLMTSVGLTMPSAFTVTNSPLTGAGGTLAVTGAGVASQYIRGDGTLASFPTGGGGGSSVSYYLNGGTNQGTFVGNTYYEMSKNAVIGTGVDFTINANGYISQFITDANDPAQLVIPAGNWNFEMYFSASSSGGSPSFYVELYKYNGSTFTLIADNSANPEYITNGTAIDLYTTAVAVPETSLTITDRLAIRVYVLHASKTITLHTQNSHLCEVITTFSTGITALNGLTAQVQTFAVGTSGTDFAISSATSTHTFNLPTASATNRGALSSADWSTFNSKQGTITLTTTGTSGAATLVGATLNIPNYAPDLSGYVTLATTQTISGIKTFSGTATYNKSVGLYYGASSSTSGYLTLGSYKFSSSIDRLTINSDAGGVNGLNFYSASSNTYNFPNSTGTIALTSDLTGGTVTSVAALTIGTSGTDLSSTVATSTTTPVITLNVPTASATNRGALSSADWTTFNNKQSALTNPVTGTGTTNYLPKFTGASTIGNSLIQDNGSSVSIGTSPSAYASSLLVYATGNQTDEVSAMSIGNVTSNTMRMYFGVNNNNTYTYIGSVLSGQAYKPLVLQPNGSSVLIGTTTDLGYKLDVNGTGRFTSNLLAQKVQVGTAASINDATGVGNTLQFANYSAGVFVTGSADSYIYKTSGVFGGLSAQTLIFQTRSDVAGGGFAFVAGSTPSAVATISNTGAATFSSSVTANTYVEIVGDLRFNSSSADRSIYFRGSTASPDANWKMGTYISPTGATIVTSAATVIDVYGGAGADYGFMVRNTSNSPLLQIAGNTGQSYFLSSVQAGYNFLAKGTLQGYSGAGIFMSYESYGGRIESYDYSASTWKNIAIAPNGGNVGIGTTSPQSTYKFTISGTDSIYPAIYLENTTNSQAYSIRATGTNFVIRDNTSGNDRITLTSGGNLGLGVANPTSKLYVAGAGVFEGTLTTAPTGFGSGAFKIGIVQSGSASSAAGYLPIVVDGTQYYINLYNATP
jgi:hypothetical protein